MRRFFDAYKTYVKVENDNNFRVRGGGGGGGGGAIYSHVYLPIIRILDTT